MSIRVLLVDDESVTRRYIARLPLWERGDFSLCAQAQNAQEALAYLARHPVDVLLTDVSMPGMDGVTLAAKVAQRHPGVAILAISNHDSYTFVRGMMHNGAHDYLLKSQLDERSLEDALRRAATQAQDRGRDGNRIHLRQQIQAWLAGTAPSPFPTDGARLAVVIYTLATQEPAPPVVDGLLRLMEQEDVPGTYRIALFRPPHQVLLFCRFYEEPSTAAIQARLFAWCQQHIRESRDAFYLPITGEICPPMRDNQTLLAYVAYRFDANPTAQPVPSMTLSIAQQRALLVAMEGRDVPATQVLIRDALADAGPPRLHIALEILDLLAQVAQEQGTALPEELAVTRRYDWIVARSGDSLGQDIAQIATRVLSARQEHPPADHPLIAQVMTYLAAHYAEPIGLGDIAAHVGSNASYLSRAFHKQTGSTLVKHLTHLRLEAAKALLLSQTPLKQIAAQVGFGQYTYFLKVFKQNTGLTPKQYLSHVSKGKESAATRQNG